MKTSMSYPEVNYLAAYKLSANDLEKIAGAIDSYELREYMIYGLTQATLTFFGFGSVPTDFTIYFNFMEAHENEVVGVFYASFPPEDGFIAIRVAMEYKYMDRAAKYRLLQEIHSKFV